MPQCSNCPKPAFVLFGPESGPLCVDCYLKMAQAIDLQLATLERQANFAAAQMEAVSGVRGLVPRYPERKAPVTISGNTFHNISVKDSTVGTINTGHLQLVDAAVTVIGNQGATDAAKAFRAVTEAVVNSTTLDATTKAEALQILSALSAEAATPEQQRRGAVAKPLMTRLRELLSVGADVAAIAAVNWQHLAAVFHLPFP